MLLEQLRIVEGETLVMILSRVPVWHVGQPYYFRVKLTQRRWKTALAAIRRRIVLPPNREDVQEQFIDRGRSQLQCLNDWVALTRSYAIPQGFSIGF